MQAEERTNLANRATFVLAAFQEDVKAYEEFVSFQSRAVVMLLQRIIFKLEKPKSNSTCKTWILEPIWEPIHLCSTQVSLESSRLNFQ
eukprot:gene22824-169_t